MIINIHLMIFLLNLQELKDLKIYWNNNYNYKTKIQNKIKSQLKNNNFLKKDHSL